MTPLWLFSGTSKVPCILVLLYVWWPETCRNQDHISELNERLRSWLHFACLYVDKRLGAPFILKFDYGDVFYVKQNSILKKQIRSRTRGLKRTFSVTIFREIIYLFTSKKLIVFSIVIFMAVSVLYLIVHLQPRQFIPKEIVNHSTQHSTVPKETVNDITEPKVPESASVSHQTGIPENSTVYFHSHKATLHIHSKDGIKKDLLDDKLVRSPFELSVKHRHSKWKDFADNSGAEFFLKKYKHLFADDKNFSNVEPNKSNTIQTWWQAAAMIDWYTNSPLRYYCQKKLTVGNWHICQDSPYTITQPCIVYSFGINFDFSFDDAMKMLGCAVYSFDPSMNVESHTRGNDSAFYNIGIASVNSDDFIPRQDIYVTTSQVWKVRTLKSVIKALGHEKKIIDVLKMDIEGYEWGVVDNMMETDVLKYVRQFMLEFHLLPEFPKKEEYVYLFQIYTRLREMGFREFTVSPHPKTLTEEKFNIQGDIEFVNIFFKQSNKIKTN